MSKNNTSNPTQNIPDSWDNRISQAAAIMGLEESKMEEIFASDNFQITRDDPIALELLSDEEATPFGDLRRLFCEDHNVPLPKLRYAMKYIRGPKKDTTDDKMAVDPGISALQKKFGLKVNIEDLQIEDLLPHYNPSHRNRIHDILQQRYGDKYGAFIAFYPGTEKVAVEETLNYVSDLENGFPRESETMVDGECVRLYEVGQKPRQIVDEDPLFPGYPLKRGRSIKNRIPWNDVDFTKRQFMRLLVEDGYINPEDTSAKRFVIDTAKMSMDELKELYPETYMRYRELNEEDSLPKLRIRMDADNKSANTTQDPFNVNLENNRSY